MPKCVAGVVCGGRRGAALPSGPWEGQDASSNLSSSGPCAGAGGRHDSMRGAAPRTGHGMADDGWHTRRAAGRPAGPARRRGGRSRGRGDPGTLGTLGRGRAKGARGRGRAPTAGLRQRAARCMERSGLQRLGGSAGGGARASAGCACACARAAAAAAAGRALSHRARATKLREGRQQRARAEGGRNATASAALQTPNWIGGPAARPGPRSKGAGQGVRGAPRGRRAHCRGKAGAREGGGSWAEATTCAPPPPATTAVAGWVGVQRRHARRPAQGRASGR
jgi:hypothetical protein